MDKSSIKKILIIKNDKIGDMILSTNIFRELKKYLPNSKITAIVSNANRPLVEKNKNIDNLLILDYPPKNFKDYMKYLKMSRSLKKENFDLGIDLRGSIFNIFFLLNLANVKYKIGFYNRKLSKLLLDYAYQKDRKIKHVTFQRIDLINKALNLNAKNYWPEIAIDKEDEKSTTEFIKKNKLNKYICILPDASIEERQWHLERWDKIIKYLHENYPKYKILILGLDMKRISFLLEKNLHIIRPENPLNLRVLYLILKKSDLVISQDSGPMHLAWTAKAPLIALISGYMYRPKDLNKLNYLHPLGKNAHTIYKDMDKITVEDVKEKIDLLLEYK